MDAADTPTILVIAEPTAVDAVHPATLTTVTVARDLCHRIGGTWQLCANMRSAHARESDLLRLGASALHLCEELAGLHPSSERYALMTRKLVRERKFRYVLASATSFGKDLLPRVAAMLDAAYIGDCTGLDVEGSEVFFSRPIHAGAVTARCITRSPIDLVTLRHSAFEPAVPDREPCPVIPVDAVSHPVRTPEILDFRPTQNPRPPLVEASVVVSGGRPLGARYFEVLGPLADACGAALGATRALCDAGHAPGDFQVGQTGKIVAPQLYFAVGISGAVQHIAGMRGSKVVVAVNEDPEAPVFANADYGIVGDLHRIVPELTLVLNGALPKGKL